MISSVKYFPPCDIARDVGEPPPHTQSHPSCEHFQDRYYETRFRRTETNLKPFPTTGWDWIVLE